MFKCHLFMSSQYEYTLQISGLGVQNLFYKRKFQLFFQIFALHSTLSHFSFAFLIHVSFLLHVCTAYITLSHISLLHVDRKQYGYIFKMPKIKRSNQILEALHIYVTGYEYEWQPKAKVFFLYDSVI